MGLSGKGEKPGLDQKKKQKRRRGWLEFTMGQRAEARAVARTRSVCARLLAMLRTVIQPAFATTDGAVLAQFKWEDVPFDQHSQNYLGHSVKAAHGRSDSPATTPDVCPVPTSRDVECARV